MCRSCLAQTQAEVVCVCQKKTIRKKSFEIRSSHDKLLPIKTKCPAQHNSFSSKNTSISNKIEPYLIHIEIMATELEKRYYSQLYTIADLGNLIMRNNKSNPVHFYLDKDGKISGNEAILFLSKSGLNNDQLAKVE
jgi:hypothetical protein